MLSFLLICNTCLHGLPHVYSPNLIVSEYGAGSIRGAPAVAEPFRSVIVDRFVSLSMVSSFIIELNELRSSVRIIMEWKYQFANPLGVFYYKIHFPIYRQI
uniref:Neur_chan_LBD domain-containing protein n=1 Tax=Angiostrongylus cantonensis TaxID=6313 RepID=A0A158PAB6_ANGCA